MLWASVGLACFVLVDLGFLIWGRHVFLANWADVNKAQISGAYLTFWAAVLGLIANTVLVFVTMVYVRKTSTLVQISADQHERFHTTYVEFGLEPVIDGMYSAVGVWVVNLGISNFMVSRIEYTKSGEDAQFHDVHVVVPAGGIAGKIRLPHFFSKDNAEDKLFGVDVQIRVQTLRMGIEELSSPRGYHFRLQNDVPHAIQINYKRPRGYKCPKCDKWTFDYMDTDGLPNEGALAERKAAYLKELTDSCPKHDSKFSIAYSSGA